MESTRYDHAEGWAIEFQIPVQTLRVRLKGVQSFPVRDATGKSIPYYAEDDVKSVCRDLLMRLRSSC